MSIMESNKVDEKDPNLSLCYNCDTRVNDFSLKHCPNCNIILHPNNYIKWAQSWYIFLCLLCLIPIIIAILFSIF